MPKAHWKDASEKQAAYRKRLMKKEIEKRLQTQYEKHLKLLQPIAERWDITIADMEKGVKHYLEIFNQVGYDIRLHYDMSYFNNSKPHVGEFLLLENNDLTSNDLEVYAPLYDLRQTCEQHKIVFLCQCPHCEKDLSEVYKGITETINKI